MNDKANYNRFFDQMSPHQLFQVFDLMPDTLFWVKDSEGHLLYANKYCRENLNIESPEKIVGLTDYDLAPKNLAQQFVDDDQRVLQGEHLDGQLEMNVLRTGEVGWFSTSKRPLFDSEQRIIGTYGISRHLNQSPIDLKIMEQLKAPMDFIRQHYSRPITVKEIAEKSNLSVSALERRFQHYLSKTPKQFLIEFRLKTAHRLLLETSLPIAAIAAKTGFSDPGYFTRLYSKQVGQRPSDTRRGSD